MAKPKEKVEEIQSGAENTDGQAETTSAAPNEPGPAVETAEGGNQAPVEAAEPLKESPLLKPASAWASEKRLATWQAAMLLKASGWLGDKKVSEADFNEAMTRSLKRTQGGIHG